jgi:hypothetical protein
MHVLYLLLLLTAHLSLGCKVQEGEYVLPSLVVLHRPGVEISTGKLHPAGALYQTQLSNQVFPLFCHNSSLLHPSPPSPPSPPPFFIPFAQPLIFPKKDAETAHQNMLLALDELNIPYITVDDALKRLPRHEVVDLAMKAVKYHFLLSFRYFCKHIRVCPPFLTWLGIDWTEILNPTTTKHTSCSPHNTNAAQSLCCPITNW